MNSLQDDVHSGLSGDAQIDPLRGTELLCRLEKAR